MTIREDGTFQLEGGTHVGASTVSAGGGASHERNGPAHFMILLLGASRGIVENAENRPIRDGAKGPLPVVIIRNRAHWTKLHRTQQGAKSDIDVEAGARTQANLFTQSRQECRGPQFLTVHTGQEVGSDVITGAVGEDGEGAIGSPENL